MTTKQLKAALKSKDALARQNAIYQFAGTSFGVEALPVLRQALADEYVSCVIAAAKCIGKLGPAALESPAAEKRVKVRGEEVDLTSQLQIAGARVWSYSGAANCYSACLDALVKIGEEPDYLVEYIHSHIGVNGQDSFVDSAAALAAIGTDEAIDLLERGLEFWRPELNKANTKKVEKLLAAAEVRS